jgi:DNA-binding MarR family transcriptional regulator
MSEPAASDGLHPLLLDPTRLRIVATLTRGGETEFGFVRDRVALTDSALSKQLRTLSNADIIVVRREEKGPRRRAWIRLTLNGRETMEQHVRALRQIAADGA